MEHIGTRVKELRQKEGLKQIDFAKKCLYLLHISVRLKLEKKYHLIYF